VLRAIEEVQRSAPRYERMSEQPVWARLRACGNILRCTRTYVTDSNTTMRNATSRCVATLQAAAWRNPRWRG
jgi:hypothetical protein